MKVKRIIAIGFLTLFCIYCIGFCFYTEHHDFELYKDKLIEQIESYHNKKYNYIKISNIDISRKNKKVNVVESVEASDAILVTYNSMDSITTYLSKKLFNESWNMYIYSLHWMCADIEDNIDSDKYDIYFSIKVVDPNDYSKVYLWIDEYGVIKEDITKINYN